MKFRVKGPYKLQINKQFPWLRDIANDEGCLLCEVMYANDAEIMCEMLNKKKGVNGMEDHICKEMDDSLARFIRWSEKGKEWNLFMVNHELVSGITFCPFCGVKLPDEPEYEDGQYKLECAGRNASIVECEGFKRNGEWLVIYPDLSTARYTESCFDALFKIIRKIDLEG